MDGDEENDFTPEERLKQRHKQEKKDLRAEIQRLKHGVGKNEKKRKKELMATVAQMEADLEARHAAELAEFTNNDEDRTEDVSEISERLDNVTTDDSSPVTLSSQPRKPSRAQKRRDKKDQKMKEREELIRQQEVENQFSKKNLEAGRLKEILKARGLKIHEVPSDGNCLYAAVENQLLRQSTLMSVDELRQQTAGYMRTHQDDFLPFLSHPSSEEPMTADDFEEYCHRLETQPEWGGQLEIQALSCSLERPIEVIQAEGPHILIGEHYSHPTLLLSYHRHVYQLGEHYNSVVTRTLQDDEEDEDDDDDRSNAAGL